MKKFLFLIISLTFAACVNVPTEDQQEAQLHLRIGTAHLLKENYPHALSELLKAAEQDPENAVIQNNLGLTYFFRERYDLAENHVRKAIKLEPKYSDAKNNLSRILIERGKYEEAAKEAEVVIKDLTYPNPEKPLINFGIAKFRLGQYELAKKSLAKAIEYQRDSCLAHNFYGRSLYEMNDHSRASEALDRAASFCQKLQFDEAQYYSALSYFQLGEKSKAETRFESLLKLYPNGRYNDKAKAMLETIRR